MFAALRISMKECVLGLANACKTFGYSADDDQEDVKMQLHACMTTLGSTCTFKQGAIM